MAAIAGVCRQVGGCLVPAILPGISGRRISAGVVAGPSTTVVYLDGHLSNTEDLVALLASRGRNCSGTAQTELLASLYEEFGDSSVDHLQGHFSIVIATPTAAVMARDRFGTRPLHYTMADDGQSVWFAPDAKTLNANLPGKRELDLQRLTDFLLFGEILGNGSLLAGIRTVKHGTAVCITPGEGRLTLAVRPMAALAAADLGPIERSEAIERVSDLLGKAVSDCLGSADRVGIALSGGLDSAVLALLSPRTDERALHAVTLVSDAMSQDQLMARHISSVVGSPHREISVTFEAFLKALPATLHAREHVTISGISFFLLTAACASDVAVCLSGVGAEDVFHDAQVPINWNVARARISARIDGAVAKGLPVSSEARHVMGVIRASGSFDAYFDHPDYPDAGAAWVDSCCAVNGVDMHSPFYADRLSSFAASLPPSLKQGSVRASKSLLHDLVMTRLGDSVPRSTFNKSGSMPDVVIGHHRRFAEMCSSALGDSFVQRHPLGFFGFEKHMLILIDLFKAMLIDGAAPGDLDVIEFVRARS